MRVDRSRPRVVGLVPEDVVRVAVVSFPAFTGAAGVAEVSAVVALKVVEVAGGGVHGVEPFVWWGALLG